MTTIKLMQKPPIVEAIQRTGTNDQEIIDWMEANGAPAPVTINDDTFTDGDEPVTIVLYAPAGNYIVRTPAYPGYSTWQAYNQTELDNLFYPVRD